MKDFTKQQFLSFYPDVKHAEECYDATRKALQDQGILTPMTLIGALATIRVEGDFRRGNFFKPIREFTTGERYEFRRDLGNTEPGDGFKYRGAGYIMLTGRANMQGLTSRTGIDFINKPELLLGPEYSALALADFFKHKNVYKSCDARLWHNVRLIINGGSNGLDLFLKVVNSYLKRYEES
jgi:hypothetical protein